jgi:hypothetical protein
MEAVNRSRRRVSSWICYEVVQAKRFSPGPSPGWGAVEGRGRLVSGRTASIVEVLTCGGHNWRFARLGLLKDRFAWRRWQLYGIHAAILTTSLHEPGYFWSKYNHSSRAIGTRAATTDTRLLPSVRRLSDIIRCKV